MKYHLLAAVTFAVLVSGCNRKAEGQTVAVVNGEEITVPDLNFSLELAKLPDGANKDVARSQALQQLVDRRLLAEQARKEGIDKSPEYLNRKRRSDEDLLISMLAARRLNTAQMPSDREVQNYIATHPQMFAKREIWVLDQLKYATPKDPAILKEIQETHSIAQLAAVLQQHNIAIQRVQNRLDSAVVPPELYNRLSTLPADEPFVLPLGDQSVASGIASKEPRPLVGDDAKPAAVDAMRKASTSQSLQGLIKTLRQSATITYQPGYAPKKS